MKQAIFRTPFLVPSPDWGEQCLPWIGLLSQNIAAEQELLFQVKILSDIIAKCSRYMCQILTKSFQLHEPASSASPWSPWDFDKKYTNKGWNEKCFDLVWFNRVMLMMLDNACSWIWFVWICCWAVIKLTDFTVWNSWSVAGRSQTTAIPNCCNLLPPLQPFVRSAVEDFVLFDQCSAGISPLPDWGSCTTCSAASGSLIRSQGHHVQELVSSPLLLLCCAGKYCSKEHFYSWDGMTARIQIAIMDHNENCNR